MLLHGDKDTDVPYSQSLMMVNELKRIGVDHELITIHDGEHGFDKDFRDPSVADVFSRVVKFLKEHLAS